MEQSVVIVGAGIIGGATALQLSRAGSRVTVVTSGAPDATQAAFGWINASFYLNDDHHRLRAAGIRAWHRVMKDVAAPVVWQGCLCWDMPEAAMEETYAQLRGFEYPVELLSGSAVSAREPALKTTPKQALFFPSEGAASSGDLARAFLAAAQDAGARVISNVAVTGIALRNGRGVGVVTTQGVIAADQVIIAAGTGTAALAQSIDCTIPLVPRPAYILRTNRQEKILQHILATPDGEIRQEPSGQILMPISVGHQGDDTENLSQMPDDAADAATGRLRGLCDGLADARWAEVIRAERPVPQDGLPVVGPLAEGVYVAVLHSGITLGPIIAELIAKDIAGRLDNADAAMIAPYRPQRFAKS
ncbi:NAD(P)/FAD-dependent oxidoreductase [Yoonia sp. R78084]|uniref:NAD(P)/FAD-dependent oxidoreductase n=1 Tax=Yoonia sp. R78084 TaxID=3093869 RepID=UPI0037DCB245